MGRASDGEGPEEDGSDVPAQAGRGDAPGRAPDARAGPAKEDVEALESARSLLPGAEGTLDRALALVSFLREHCPWDRKQTPLSLVPHLLEEAHEAADAIRRNDPPGLADELGDLLLNLAFQVVIGEERRDFSAEEVVRRLEIKMIRRHPHLFGIGQREPWERIKARERRSRKVASTVEGSGEGKRPGEPLLGGLPPGLEPLVRAHRIQERVSGVGFDWEDAAGALAKVEEELAEVAEAIGAGEAGAVEEELGDLLFAMVNLARLSGHRADGALTRANAKFQRRFQALEELAAEGGMDLDEASLEEMDQLWEEVKRRCSPEGAEGG